MFRAAHSGKVKGLGLDSVKTGQSKRGILLAPSTLELRLSQHTITKRIRVALSDFGGCSIGNAALRGAAEASKRSLSQGHGSDVYARFQAGYGSGVHARLEAGHRSGCTQGLRNPSNSGLR